MLMYYACAYTHVVATPLHPHYTKRITYTTFTVALLDKQQFDNTP